MYNVYYTITTKCNNSHRYLRYGRAADADKSNCTGACVHPAEEFI